MLREAFWAQFAGRFSHHGLVGLVVADVAGSTIDVSFFDGPLLPFPNRARPIARSGARGRKFANRTLQAVARIVVVAGVYAGIG